ncbi:MAG: 3-hydroxyacyl-ACP dehydratase FabZ family protein [Mycobacteriales bacterium]
MSDPLTRPVRREVASPLVAPVQVESPEAGRASSRFTLDPAEPLLAGHYPGFPIFPGVCLVECAHRTSLGALDGPARLTEVESARFLGPVFPGDTVHTEAVAEPVGGGWRCRVRLAAEGPEGPEGRHGPGPGGPGGPGGDGRRQVAVVRLRYGRGAA